MGLAILRNGYLPPQHEEVGQEPIFLVEPVLRVFVLRVQLEVLRESVRVLDQRAKIGHQALLLFRYGHAVLLPQRCLLRQYWLLQVRKDLLIGGHPPVVVKHVAHLVVYFSDDLDGVALLVLLNTHQNATEEVVARLAVSDDPLHVVVFQEVLEALVIELEEVADTGLDRGEAFFIPERVVDAHRHLVEFEPAVGLEVHLSSNLKEF